MAFQLLQHWKNLKVLLYFEVRRFEDVWWSQNLLGEMDVQDKKVW